MSAIDYVNLESGASSFCGENKDMLLGVSILLLLGNYTLYQGLGDFHSRLGL